MLSKLSKITDLIARLDAYKRGDEADRVKKPNPQNAASIFPCLYSFSQPFFAFNTMTCSISTEATPTRLA